MAKRLRVVLADLSYYNEFASNSHYTPLNVAYLAQYLRQQAGDALDIVLFKDPDLFRRDVAETRPDIVGISLYYWNTDLGRRAGQYVRRLYGDGPVIVYGGPSVDSDPGEQVRLLGELPAADFLVENEGELGFWNIVERLLAGRSGLRARAIDGATFLDGGARVAGASVGLGLDLATLGSPYLSGLLDGFLTEDYQPLIQTSRLCPYTCAFCVAGKNRGKIRAFPIEQVKEEIAYVARRYKGREHQVLYLADDNFGLLERDREIAEHIRACAHAEGYPRAVYFYNDKRFTDTSKAVIEILGEFNHMGLALALQSENPDTLKAINRRNLSDADIGAAIQWAKDRDMPTTTELIFGLPFETSASFANLLDRSVRRGFDSVLCHNLFIVDGIELNRPAVRDTYGLQTAFRPLRTNYGYFDGQFVAEHEEVVVASSTFDRDDYMVVRGMNFMFYAVFSLNFFKPVFQLLKESRIELSALFEAFLARRVDEPGYRRFVADFWAAVDDELFPSREAMVDSLKSLYDGNGGAVGEPNRINVTFGARLIYQERDWHLRVLGALLAEAGLDEGLMREALALAERERIDLRGRAEPEPLTVHYDFIGWRRDKFAGMPARLPQPRTLVFEVAPDVRAKIESFVRQHGAARDEVFYYFAMTFIVPRHTQLYTLRYAEEALS